MQCSKGSSIRSPSSAVASNVGGAVRPIISAVPALMTKSILVGVITGRSAELALTRGLCRATSFVCDYI
jgi:hypothetical protein